MSLLHKQLATFTKRPIKWTGLLERTIREFIEAAELELSEADLDRLYAIPERLVPLVLSGVLEALELNVGDEGCSIALPLDPDLEDDLDLSTLMLCDLSGRPLEVSLVTRETALARALGADTLTKPSSEGVVVSLRTTGVSPAVSWTIEADGSWSRNGEVSS